MNNHTADVIIVGGGAMGAAAAYHLARAGQRVLLFEQFAIGHGLGSSHGPSRIIRLAYDSADYVELARAAYKQWDELAAESDEQLLVRVGGLDVGTPDAFALDGIRETFEATGVPFEQLDRDEIKRRFPQYHLPEGTIGLYQADYALLAADRCVATLARLAQHSGAVIRGGEPARHIRPIADGVEVTTDAGVYRADRLILSAGSWMRPLLHQLDLDLPLTILKEQVAFFAVADPQLYTPERLPLLLHRFPGTTSLGSVFPTFNHAGIKLMLDRTGPEVAPDDLDRSIDEPQLAQLHAYASALVPGITGEIIEAVSCRYTMTPDEDFIIDRHPAYPQVVIASPCSGHGFKFSIAIGEILADLAIRGTTAHPIERFRLDRPTLAV